MGARTLRDILNERGYIAEPEIQALFLKVARYLHTAHKNASYHGDIKPEKIIRFRDGTYGLTAYRASRIGTARYMSPERASRNPTDNRSDIYSLGVVMYEAAIGKPPFEGMNFEVLQAHINDEPTPPKELHPEISEGLQRVIMTAMAKKPDDRYQTAGALADALRDLSAELAVNLENGRQRVVSDEEVDQQFETEPTTPFKTPAGTMSGRRPSPGKPGRPSRSETSGGGKTLVAEQKRAVPSASANSAVSTRPATRPVPVRRVARPVPRRSTKLPIIGGAVGLLVLGGLLFLLFGGGSKVPEVHGQDREQVFALAERAGLAVAIEGSRDDTLPAGRVVGQRPLPGTKVQRDDTLFIFLSTGEVRVPDILGLDTTEVPERLAVFRMSVTEVDTGYSDDFPVGVVVEVEPAVGEVVDAGSTVRLTVSAGLATCPDCGALRVRDALFCIVCGYRFDP